MERATILVSDPDFRRDRTLLPDMESFSDLETIFRESEEVRDLAIGLAQSRDFETQLANRREDVPAPLDPRQ